MTAVIGILAGLLVLAGSAFTVIAALGLLRLPDLYTRMHAASKAGSAGAGLLLLALALVADEAAEALRAVGTIVFLLLTTPISAHLLAKAAHAVGYPLWDGSKQDEMPADRGIAPEPQRSGSTTRPVATKWGLAKSASPTRPRLP